MPFWQVVSVPRVELPVVVFAGSLFPRLPESSEVPLAQLESPMTSIVAIIVNKNFFIFLTFIYNFIITIQGGVKCQLD